jgi:hypothetical protein
MPPSSHKIVDNFGARGWCGAGLRWRHHPPGRTGWLAGTPAAAQDPWAWSQMSSKTPVASMSAAVVQ